jgi:hydrogenase nickel incorporation protein HypB
MCKECGCEDEHDHHEDVNPHFHPSVHDHARRSKASETALRTISVEKKILSRNDQIAEYNRQWLAEQGVVALNLISAPGSGKTFLLEKTLDRLRGRVPCAVITGDLRTDNDARRLQGRGAIVCQIETVSACHLDAERVRQYLPDITRDNARLLFIENVGNLVCPAAFDLGENFKVALLSATEGEDKPVKYPSLFSLAPVTILTKMDLVPHLDWNISQCREYLRKIHPGVTIIEVSAKTGQGMDSWIDYLEHLVM